VYYCALITLLSARIAGDETRRYAYNLSRHESGENWLPGVSSAAWATRSKGADPEVGDFFNGVARRRIDTRNPRFTSWCCSCVIMLAEPAMLLKSAIIPKMAGARL